jgi:hypothetical protein
MSERNCTEMCEMSYDEEMTWDEFWEELQENWPDFKENMDHLGNKGGYPEDMIQLFAAWMEMEKGDSK